MEERNAGEANIEPGKNRTSRDVEGTVGGFWTGPSSRYPNGSAATDEDRGGGDEGDVGGMLRVGAADRANGFGGHDTGILSPVIAGLAVI